jgi:hypothetical protein
MSLLRKTAEKIAVGVVRYASPGSKGWAEALAGELVYIESDWRALMWALSGVRVLLRWEPPPLRTLGDLDLAAQKYADRRRHAVNNVWVTRNLPWLTILLCGWSFPIQIFLGHDVVANTAVSMGYLLLGGAQYISSREPVVPDRDDQPGLIRFYLDELTASSSMASVRFWMFLAGDLFIAAGFELVAFLSWERVLGLVWLAVLVFVLLKQQRNRKRIAQIQALLPSLLSD